MATTYFHGGPPGFTKGMRILPPSMTGVPSCSEFGAAGIHRRDRVYLAADYQAALVFAALHPSGRGCIYEVTPDAELEPDPDWRGEPGQSVQTTSATIVKVHRVYPSIANRVRQLMLAVHQPK